MHDELVAMHHPEAANDWMTHRISAMLVRLDVREDLWIPLANCLKACSRKIEYHGRDRRAGTRNCTEGNEKKGRCNGQKTSCDYSGIWRASYQRARKAV